MPRLQSNAERRNDFYFIEKTELEEALRIILELVGSRIRNAFGFDPIDEVHILTPMDRGLVGTTNLNVELQKALNPREDGVTRGGRNFRFDDKVMQIRNNYDKDVFNGDIGRTIRIETEMQELTIAFDGRAIVYDYSYQFVFTYIILSRVISRFMLCLPHWGGRRYGQSKQSLRSCIGGGDTSAAQDGRRAETP
jgi:exodeoxyribonuclease V alpha subunit